MLEFNCEQEDVVRIPISLKFAMDDMYENLIVPARSARTLTKLIQDLLQLYYENEYVRDLIERPEEVETEYMSDYDAIMQSINNLLASQKESADRTMILETQIGGMNAYLEQQQEILSEGLVGGLDSDINAFVRETATEPIKTKALAITDVHNVVPVAMNTNSVDNIGTADTEIQIDNSADFAEAADVIEDITDDYSDLDDDIVDDVSATLDSTATIKQVKHTIGKVQMHNAVKKPTSVNLDPNLMRLMSGMEKP